MLPDRVSNPGPLTYESGALPIALRGPIYDIKNCYFLSVISFIFDILRCIVTFSEFHLVFRIRAKVTSLLKFRVLMSCLSQV